jgi:hypothetical protein
MHAGQMKPQQDALHAYNLLQQQFSVIQQVGADAALYTYNSCAAPNLRDMPGGGLARAQLTALAN